MAFDIKDLDANEHFKREHALPPAAVPVKPVAQVKAQATPKAPPIDFTKLSEQSAYDLSIPIVAVEHSLPEHLTVTLADGNYLPRWVQEHPQRLGTLKAMGYTYVTSEDLAEDLKLEIQPDENGHFKYIDVILMKQSKEKYLGQLRRNFLDSLALTDSKKLHAGERNRIDNILAENSDYQAYKDNGRLGII